MFWVYILENPTGRFYIGRSDDLDRRVRQHNTPRPEPAKFTLTSGPWMLAWSESHPSRPAAMIRERRIKQWKSAARMTRELLDSQSPGASRRD